MKAESFCYWLQGWFELNNPKSASGEVLEIIQNHLNMVFKHDIDPKMGDEKHQQELTSLHKPPIAIQPNNISGNNNEIFRC